MKLEDLEIYKISMQLSDEIWLSVMKWDYFSKKTIGSQITSSADSVSANISEGCGRYYFGDSKRFFYYSRGSLFETKTWLTKIKSRNLMPLDQVNILLERYEKLGVKLNNFISALNKLSPPNGK